MNNVQVGKMKTFIAIIMLFCACRKSGSHQETGRDQTGEEHGANKINSFETVYRQIFVIKIKVIFMFFLYICRMKF